MQAGYHYVRGGAVLSHRDEPGRHVGFCGSQRGRAFRRREKGGSLRLGGRLSRAQNWVELGRTARGLVRRHMGRRRWLSIWAAAPIVWPSPITAWWLSNKAAFCFAGKTIATSRHRR